MCGKINKLARSTYVVHGFPEKLQLVLGHAANLQKRAKKTLEKRMEPVLKKCPHQNPIKPSRQKRMYIYIYIYIYKYIYIFIYIIRS